MQSLLILINIILIECILSVDNAAVLAVMVSDLPEHSQNRALRYGIIGAYAFRGIALLFAAFLVKIWWMKIIGGFYLLYLCYDHFKPKEVRHTKDHSKHTSSKLYRLIHSRIGQFWATVILVEVMDIAFSIDNIFAVVSYTDRVILLWTGVFIGILAMRFVAGYFVRLINRFPRLETSAFIVIGILGLNLALSLLTHLAPNLIVSQFLESEHAQWTISILTLVIFFAPLISGRKRTKA